MPDTIKRQKKITIHRDVKVTHPGYKDEPTHDGELELARQTEGSKKDTDLLTMRTAGGAGSYVAVPFNEFFPAFLELADSVPGTIDELKKMLKDW